MKILIADDEAAIRQSLRLILSSESYEILESGELAEVHSLIIKEQPDLLLLDIHFKGATSLDLMRRMISEQIQVPTIVLSGAASAAEAALAIKLGAYDFIEKPISADRLRLTIERCLESLSLRQSLQVMTNQPSLSVEIIGQSAETKKIRRAIEQYAKKDVKVLITGETGVGKEVVAQSIWKSSERAARPFIIVNSAAIPDNLIESELFGHRKGSFTGAVSDQVGKIEMADRGTLFLDEIGDLSPSAQTKLLRFLESGEIQKVGSNQIKKVDVRLVAATSRDLEKEIEKGLFRPDLFYRLNVARISIAPLRERTEDVAPLFSYFVNGFCSKFGEAPKVIAQEAIDALLEHSWPGNIRELRNVAERVSLISDARILREHLAQVLTNLHRTKTPQTQVSESPREILPLKEFKNKTEREYIEFVLNHTGGSITQAALLLKIDRTYLHQKMVTHGISNKKGQKGG